MYKYICVPAPPRGSCIGADVVCNDFVVGAPVGAGNVSKDAPLEFCSPELLPAPNNFKSGARLWHVCTSTADFLRKMGQIPVQSADRLVRLDIEDFYMRGSHETLIQHSFDLSDPLEGELSKGLDFLLSNQFCYSRDLSELFFVSIGSGMGACHSGQISDWTLYRLGEERWATDTAIQAQFGVKGWLR